MGIVFRQRHSILRFSATFLAALLLSTRPASAEHVGIDLIDPSLATALDDVMLERGDWCAGLSLGVVIGDRIVYTKAYGSHRIDHLHQWASISKPVTAMMVMQLVEAGSLDLHVPIWEYAPAYDDIIPDWHRETPLTLFHLLTHQGGVRHAGHQREPEMFIEVPGTSYGYSTNGYGVIGDVLVAVQEVDYVELLDVMIAERIGATTMTTWEDFLSPAAFVTSNIEDMCLFALGVMRHVFVPENVLFDEVLQDYGHQRGLGFVVSDVTSGVAADHGGSNGIPQSHLHLRPREDIAITLFCTAHSTDTLYFDETIATLEDHIRGFGNPDGGLPSDAEPDADSDSDDSASRHTAGGGGCSSSGSRRAGNEWLKLLSI